MPSLRDYIATLRLDVDERTVQEQSSVRSGMFVEARPVNVGAPEERHNEITTPITRSLAIAL